MYDVHQRCKQTRHSDVQAGHKNGIVTVPNCSQNNVMNVCRFLYSVLVINQSKKIKTYCPASVSKCGYSGIFLVCSIQVHPLLRLLFDLAWSGLSSEHMILLKMIPHMARLCRNSLYISFLGSIHSRKQVSDLVRTLLGVSLHGLLPFGLHLSQGPGVHTTGTSCALDAWNYHLKGLSHEIFGPVFWLVWMYLGLNVNRLWFLNFYDALLILDN